jgi:ABC-type branched-subunit amino acid transport system ATPase component
VDRRAWRIPVDYQGHAIILVERNPRRASTIASHLYRMQGGRDVMSKPTEVSNLARPHDPCFAGEDAHA